MANQTTVTGASVAPRAVTVGRAAELLAVSTRSVWRLIGRGDLAVVRMGRAVRVTVTSIDALVARGGAR